MEDPQTSNAMAAPQVTSLGSRLMNIYIAPTDVFDEVKSSPERTANWLLPVVLAIIAGIIYTMVVFSNEQVIQNMRAPAEKNLQEMVDAKKMTQQQADQGIAVMEKIMSPTNLKVAWIIVTILMNAVMLFVLALILWLIGTYGFKSPFNYMKAVEVVGLSFMISVVERIISTLLAIIYGNVSMTPGPVLLVGQFDPKNKLHVALSMMNVFLFWSLALWALGLARLGNKSFLKSFICVFLFLGCIVLIIVGIFYMLAQALAKLGKPGGN